ncbi:MAG TPA: hypothetical protein VJ437_13485 [Acidiferrobacterales bacterium]|nr:hypothetical protein [Acidiferrobacterales bacterium]
MIRQTLTLSLFALANLSLPAQAATDLDLGGIALQSDFRLLSEDLGAALSYKPLIPAEPLGVTGFDLGIEVTATKLEHAAIFDNAVTGDAPDTLYLPKLHVHKGLPFGFDIGASYAAVPDSNIKLWGAEVRYAILKGSTATPAVAVRGSYSALQGVDQLKLTTTSVDLSISKGFALFTPYAGIGKVWVTSTPDPSTGLVEEDFDLNKVFVGVNMNLAVINIAIEGDKTGDATSYGIKFGWRF